MNDTSAMDMATAYANRRSMRAGSASTLRKAAKMLRIAAGDRSYPAPERTRKGYGGRTQVYHPTKGWRWP